MSHSGPTDVMTTRKVGPMGPKSCLVLQNPKKRGLKGERRKKGKEVKEKQVEAIWGLVQAI